MGTVAAALIAWRLRSFDALICVLALLATMSLRAFPVPFIPVATTIWCLAGLIVLFRGSYLVGALYGLSGLVYLWGYQFEDARFAPLHFASDGFYILGLLVVIWKGGIFSFDRGADRRGVYRDAVAVQAQDLARSAGNSEIGLALDIEAVGGAE